MKYFEIKIDGNTQITRILPIQGAYPSNDQLISLMANIFQCSSVFFEYSIKQIQQLIEQNHQGISLWMFNDTDCTYVCNPIDLPEPTVYNDNPQLFFGLSLFNISTNNKREIYCQFSPLPANNEKTYLHITDITKTMNERIQHYTMNTTALINNALEQEFGKHIF